MAVDDKAVDDKAQELTALVQEIRDRVRARYPESGGRLNVALDLMPLIHARDAAEAKVAAIGTVNPRRGGPLNALAQVAKKLVSRALDWHVREQVEFNRQVMACVEATLEALNETKRTLMRMDPDDVRDLRSHWTQWRTEWEQKLFINETQFLRGVADLQGSFQHRATMMEATFRDLSRAQHADYLAALERSTTELQKRFWEEAAKARREYERLIHEELRIVRQRAGSAPQQEQAAVPAPAKPAPRGSPIRLRALRRALPRSGRVRQEEYSVLLAALRGTRAGARYRVRARRVPGNDAGRGRRSSRHRTQ